MIGCVYFSAARATQIYLFFLVFQTTTLVMAIEMWRGLKKKHDVCQISVSEETYQPYPQMYCIRGRNHGLKAVILHFKNSLLFLSIRCSTLFIYQCNGLYSIFCNWEITVAATGEAHFLCKLLFDVSISVRSKLCVCVCVCVCACVQNFTVFVKASRWMWPCRRLRWADSALSLSSRQNSGNSFQTSIQRNRVPVLSKTQKHALPLSHTLITSCQSRGWTFPRCSPLRCVLFPSDPQRNSPSVKKFLFLKMTFENINITTVGWCVWVCLVLFFHVTETLWDGVFQKLHFQIPLWRRVSWFVDHCISSTYKGPCKPFKLDWVFHMQ